MSADDVLPPRTAHNVELRHGYTVDQVRGLSIWTVMHDPYHCFADFDERQHFRRGYSNREQDRDARRHGRARGLGQSRRRVSQAPPQRTSWTRPAARRPGRSAGDRHYGLLACWSSWSVLTARSLWSRGQAEERGEG
jgi:hypothetical protein